MDVIASHALSTASRRGGSPRASRCLRHSATPMSAGAADPTASSSSSLPCEDGDGPAASTSVIVSKRTDELTNEPTNRVARGRITPSLALDDGGGGLTCRFLLLADDDDDIGSSGRRLRSVVVLAAGLLP